MAIDSTKFRSALGYYASGITIISSITNDVPVGFTCQSFCSVSLDPPLVSFSVMKKSNSWPKIKESNRPFCINVLSSTQVELSDTFARSSINRWANVGWELTMGENPGIPGALLWLDCTLYAEHEAGDHWIVIAEVNHITELAPEEAVLPLLYYRGKYHPLNPI